MGRLKKVLSTVEIDPVSTTTIPEQEVKIEDIKKEDEKVYYEFVEGGKKYRKTYDEKGNSLGVVEL